MPSEDENKTLLGLTAQIVSAHVGKNQVPPAALPALIEQVHAALRSAGQEQVPAAAERQQPFVAAKRSIFPDYIICLEDGRKLKTLKRHLRSFGLSPEQYREKWSLGADYPMVAPNYAEHRSRLAKQLGLGRKQAAEEETAAPEEPADPAPEPHETRRRTEPTAASVFAKFPSRPAEPAPDMEEPAEELPARKKRGRKPFSKQLARSMPR